MTDAHFQKREHEPRRKLSILLTGSTGVIGSRVTKALLEEGHDVYAIVRNPRKLSQVLGGQSQDRLMPLEGDLLASSDLARLGKKLAAVGNIDAVIHMAGGGALTCNNRFTPAIFDLNCTTTVNLLALLKETHKIESLSLFLYYSSLAAMGSPRSGEHRVLYQESRPCDPVLPYERAKLKTEEILRKVAEDNRFATVVLRFPQIYGGENDAFMQMLRLMRWRLFPAVPNETGTLPLLHVVDSVRATCAVLSSIGQLNNDFDVNLVCEGSYSYRYLAQLVRNKHGTGGILELPYPILYALIVMVEYLFRFWFLPEPLNRHRLRSMMKDRVVDCTKFMKAYNFKPSQSVQTFVTGELSSMRQEEHPVNA